MTTPQDSSKEQLEASGYTHIGGDLWARRKPGDKYVDVVTRGDASSRMFLSKAAVGKLAKLVAETPCPSCGEDISFVWHLAADAADQMWKDAGSDPVGTFLRLVKSNIRSVAVEDLKDATPFAGAACPACKTDLRVPMLFLIGETMNDLLSKIEAQLNAIQHGPDTNQVYRTQADAAAILRNVVVNPFITSTMEAAKLLGSMSVDAVLATRMQILRQIADAAVVEVARKHNLGDIEAERMRAGLFQKPS